MDKIYGTTKNPDLDRDSLLKLLTETVRRIRVVDAVPVHLDLGRVRVPVHDRHVAVRVTRTVFFVSILPFHRFSVSKVSVLYPDVSGTVLHHHTCNHLCINTHKQFYVWQTTINIIFVK